MEEILSGQAPVFDRVFKKLEHILSPETVLLDEPRHLKNFPHRILKDGETNGVARHLSDNRKRREAHRRRQE